MAAPHLTLDSLPQPGESQIISASSLSLQLSAQPRLFFRHGWQSWALTTWLDPRSPPLPVRAAEFRMKDEDPVYALAKNHVSAWVGALQLGEDDILLLGALDFGGRVEIEGLSLKGFYESVERDNISLYGWLLARGNEAEVFARYAAELETKFGRGRFERAPRVWCSWYSLYGWVNERVLLKALYDFGDMPFDVFQLDDGWQRTHGDWEANQKFPSGMQALAEKIASTGRTPGLWLAPFMVSPKSQLAREHPDWLLRDETRNPVPAGITWGGHPRGLDVSHPAVLEWLDRLIRKVRGWGYGYLKLDFLYIGALPGKRYQNISRELAYRNALQVMREAAGDAYLLACGAPILPSLGLCDGLRVGPDVAPFWLNKPLTIWLNNPNDTSTQNAIRTSIHRLWLGRLTNVDPDVQFFRSRFNWLLPHEQQLLEDLGTIAGFKATSDLPQWMTAAEKARLRDFLESSPPVHKKGRYSYQVEGQIVDFNPVIPIPSARRNIPVWLAKSLGLVKVALAQAVPAILEARRS